MSIKLDNSEELEALDDFNELVDDKTEEIYKLISVNSLYKNPNEADFNGLYHFNDFVQDCIEDFDNLVYDVFKGEHEKVKTDVDEKLWKWCEKLATKVIKGEI